MRRETNAILANRLETSRDSLDGEDLSYDDKQTNIFLKKDYLNDDLIHDLNKKYACTFTKTLAQPKVLFSEENNPKRKDIKVGWDWFYSKLLATSMQNEKSCSLNEIGLRINFVFQEYNSQNKDIKTNMTKDKERLEAEQECFIPKLIERYQKKEIKSPRAENGKIKEKKFSPRFINKISTSQLLAHGRLVNRLSSKKNSKTSQGLNLLQITESVAKKSTEASDKINGTANSQAKKEEQDNNNNKENIIKKQESKLHRKMLSKNKIKLLSDVKFIKQAFSKVQLDDIDSYRHEIGSYEKEFNKVRHHFNLSNKLQMTEHFFNFSKYLDDLKFAKSIKKFRSKDKIETVNSQVKSIIEHLTSKKII